MTEAAEATRSERMPRPDTIRGRYVSLRGAQKIPRGVPAYTLWVNRPAGRLFAAAAPPWLTPNGVTLVSAALTYGVLALVWVLPVGAGVASVVGVLLALGFALDSADGQLARLRGGGTPLGEWLDHVLDAGRIALLHVTVAAYVVRAGWPVEALAWVALFAVTATLIYAGGLLVDKVRTAAAPGAPRSMRVTPTILARSIVLLPVDYGVLCVVFLLLPWPGVFLSAYVVLAVASAALCAAYLARWVRELRAASAP